MLVRDAMSETVVRVGPDTTIAEAAKAMQSDRVSVLLATDGDAITGVLTERDLLAVLTDGVDPATTTVADRMARSVVTIGADADTDEARELMGKHGIRHLPVLDGGAVVGIVKVAEPSTSLHFAPRRDIPAWQAERPEVIDDFRGPFADGPPADALRVDAPPLDEFGFAEVRRAIVTGWIIGFSIVVALLQRRWKVLRRRPVDGWWEVLSSGVVDAFEKLGPAYVKVGQMIASSPGVFPETLADACQRTLDEVPPFDGATTRRVIEEDLGHPPEQLFRYFDERPLASASIGQVHACVLPDGRQAVVKIQRPGIRDRMTQDLRITYRIARFAMRFDWLKSADPVGIIEDNHEVTFNELNPALEAKRQHDFREKIHFFGDNDEITAPEVFWNYCGPRVICMERMSGVPMDEFEELDRRGIDGEMVLRRGAKVWIESVCVHGPFHGDMHAGNIWVLDDGRASYLDFGIMGNLPDEYKDVVKDILYTCMIDGDFTRIAKAYRRVGVFPEDMGTDEELGMRLQMILGPMLEAGIGGMNLGDMLKMSIDLMDNYQGQGAKELVLIAKQLAYIERYAKGLAPNYQIIRDVFLIKNIFPEAAAAKLAETGGILPD